MAKLISIKLQKDLKLSFVKKQGAMFYKLLTTFFINKELKMLQT